ncbi:hypothetical protein [Alienimonas californiensis]|uniref:Uncharacterized protein n=1 Tax=Alienimonas californiensis TaxID=2527989 RepID=A0A517P6A3_9PLAN|nr:hypothetical protein [Alienimonas californiensis]QDT14901.1 hypothetical protein CA12_09810 [Alienimonas californiensis]
MFARLPPRRCWIALGGSVLAAWGPWWATWVWGVTNVRCTHCVEQFGRLALFGPGLLPGHLTADWLGLDGSGWGPAVFSLAAAGAFVALLAALALSIPRARWAVWATAAASQAALAPLIVALIRM